MDTQPATPADVIPTPPRLDPAPETYLQANAADMLAVMPIQFLAADAPLTVWGGVRAPRIPVATPTLGAGERLARLLGKFSTVMGEAPRVVVECAVRFDDGYREEWGAWRSAPWSLVERLVIVPQGTALVVAGPGSAYAHSFPQWATLLANLDGALVELNHRELLDDPTLAAPLMGEALAGKAGQAGGVVADVLTSLAIWGAEAAPPTEPTSVTWAAARALAELRAQDTSEVAEVAYLQHLVETQLMRLVYEQHSPEEAERIARNFCHLSGAVVDLRALQLEARYGYPHTHNEANPFWGGLDEEERILHNLLDADQHVSESTRDSFMRLVAAGHQWRFPQLAKAHEYIYLLRRDEEGCMPWYPEGTLEGGVKCLASDVWRVLYGGRRSP